MKENILKAIWRRRQGRWALVTLIILYLSALFAPLFAPYNVAEQSLSNTFHPPVRLTLYKGKLSYHAYQKTDASIAKYEIQKKIIFPIQWWIKVNPYFLWGCLPCSHKLFGPGGSAPLYLLGADGLGRDIFSRLLYGAQVSLSIGLIGIAITLTLGFFVGGLSGYFGGRWDFLCMRLVEFLMAIPGLYLLLALRASIGGHFSSSESYLMIVVLLAFIGWASTARVIRGMSASLRQRPFVLAAEAMGQSTLKILWQHFLPNLSSYLLVAATLSIPAYILGEAALSFLGLGIQEPSASWGLMLKQTQEDLKVFMLNFWWMLLPGFAIFVSVISFNLLGDVLRDLLDPKINLKR